jgi:hypothetical protein
MKDDKKVVFDRVVEQTKRIMETVEKEIKGWVESANSAFDPL